MRADVAVLVVVMAACTQIGGAVKCWVCDSQGNACKGNFTMVENDCGGSCLKRLDTTREFYYKKCHTFFETNDCRKNDDEEDECYCNHHLCNDNDCELFCPSSSLSPAPIYAFSPVLLASAQGLLSLFV